MKAVALGFIRIFTNPWFLLLGVPVLATLLAILLRWGSKKSNSRKFESADLLIGFDLGIVAVFTMFAVTAKAAQELQALTRQLDAADVSSKASMSALAGKLQSAMELAIAAPLFGIAFIAGLIVAALLVSTKGWNSAGKLSKAWILGVDGFGLFILWVTLLMAGEVK